MLFVCWCWSGLVFGLYVNKKILICMCFEFDIGLFSL